jgi:hypothetical protein
MAVSHKPLNNWACLHVRESGEASEIVEANGNAGAELTFGRQTTVIVVDFAKVQLLVSHGGFTQTTQRLGMLACSRVG